MSAHNSENILGCDLLIALNVRGTDYPHILLRLATKAPWEVHCWWWQKVPSLSSHNCINRADRTMVVKSFFGIVIFKENAIQIAWLKDSRHHKLTFKHFLSNIARFSQGTSIQTVIFTFHVSLIRLSKFMSVWTF